MADIEIRMLGKFEILMDGKPVLSALKQSRKATMLIQYLVLQKGEKVTHKDLTDTLWNGERSTNPDMALRAIMHRFRNMIDAEGLKELETCIITSRGYYQWNPTMECRVDVFEMEALMEEARRQLNPAAAVARYERVLELYAGRLLPMFCNEPWVETRSLTLHVQYRIALFQVLEACKRKGENERIVKLCRRAIELDPYEERLYLEMIQALEALGRHEQALEMTRRGNAMGCLHHAVEPERVGVVSRQARQADRNLENDISRLAEELSADDTPGAAYCSFENFRQIYHLQRGVQSRFGVPVYLALLTMSPAQNADPAETGAAGRADPQEPAPVRRHGPLQREPVCAAYQRQQQRRERQHPAGAHQGGFLPRARPWPLPAQLPHVRPRAPRPLRRRPEKIILGNTA